MSSEKSEAKVMVHLYTRPGCHLCDEVKEQILAAGCDDLFTLFEINIESDSSLLERYGTKIPVVRINDVDLFMYRVSSGEFREAVRNAFKG